MSGKENTKSRFLSGKEMVGDKIEILPTNNLREERANTECCYLFVIGGIIYFTGQSSID